ncbi:MULTISPECIES: glycosyltransferase [Listeria]|uniref:glycosyltransferase n=1 Tax=Listeria TaxID=1637 RepID=UPI000B58C593|nr:MULTISPECIES: glycosyltransferase [Listeria]
MKKRVTMFVWNEFTNDARVLRECTALQDAGYFVCLIALKGSQPAIEKHSENFCIRRIKYELTFLHKIWIYLATLCIAYVAPPIGVLLLLFCVLLFETKARFLVRKLVLILKMTVLGFALQTDIYHANDLNTLFQGVFCAKVKRKKLIFDSHEVNTSRSGYDSKIYHIIEKWLIHFPDCVIHENETRAKYIRRIYGFTPEVIYNYPFFEENRDKVALHERLQIPENELLLLYQGGLQIGRGLENLLAAAPYIERGTIVFIGDGKLKYKLMEITKQQGLTNRVKFLDKVPVQELPSYTRNAYVGFQLLNNTCFNHFSAASNKLFEYMMAGVPVIACSFPEMKKVIRREKIGILVDSKNPVSIAAAVNDVLRNPNLQHEMSENALAARKRYNWDNEKVKFLALYQKICEGEGEDGQKERNK